MYSQIIGNILNSNEKYLVHQTNCVTKGHASGIAKVLFDKYNYSDCYINREENSIPGTIDIRGSENLRYIINLMGQFYPGKSKYPNDSENKRRKYFVSGLIDISNITALKSVAFPAGIGCGLAGGSWETYLKYIKDFYVFVNSKQPVDVTVYCLHNNVSTFNFKEFNQK
jgi:O-acetyl-ADP-ribose deacetylase (regulator of RNase III)